MFSKKKKVFTKIESDFSAGLVTFRLVGGDASRNGAGLFEIEADFSAKIVTFRLVGGCIPPPKSAAGSGVIMFMRRVHGTKSFSQELLGLTIFLSNGSCGSQTTL